MKSSLSQDLGQRLFHVRELVPPYTNRQDFVELFPCPLMSKIPETCPPGELVPEIWVSFVFVKKFAPLAEVNN